MSGPSEEQLQLQQSQIDFYNEGREHSQQVFAQQQGLLKQMQDIYDPILAKGPDQRGFSDAERSELNAQSIEGTATNYGHAARAVGEQIATRGGGDNPLPSGSEAELKQEVALSAAGEQSREQSQIQQADYASGERHFQNATDALLTASGQLNPTAYASVTNQSGSEAEETSKDINAEQNSWMAPVFGAVGALGGGLLSNPKIFQ